MVANRYQVRVTHGEVSITRRHLAYWNRARGKDIARRLLKAESSSWQAIDLGQVLKRELQDCVDRAAEQFTPDASLPLDLFWVASRGVYTYYTALDLGVEKPSGYIAFASLAALGEAVALFVLEDRSQRPDLFGLELMYRPLNDSPDFLMYRPRDPERLAVVEAKGTLDSDVSLPICEAVYTLLEVLKGWQNHRSLASTDAYAVATSFAQAGLFLVTMLRLRFAESTDGVR